MFLPVLLIRDHGWAAWVLFAIPNVLGAAAMGRAVRGSEHAKALRDAHRLMIGVFSAVTIAFQAFFAASLVLRASQDERPWWPVAAFFVGLLLANIDLSRREKDPWSGLMVWLGSLGLCGTAWWMLTSGGQVPLPAPAGVTWESGQLGPVPLAGLGLVCLFGFLACPYLDATFLRAREATGALGGRTFAVGFLVFFLSMIMLTAGYAGLPWGVGTTAGLLVGCHIALQLAYTIQAHAEELRRGTKPLAPVWVSPVGILCGSVAALATAHFGGVDGFEPVYRAFMGFYGLWFPTYVVGCMSATWSRPRPPSGKAVALWVASCLAALPFLWVAFLQQGMNWAIVGVLVALCGAAGSRWIMRAEPGTARPYPGPARPLRLAARSRGSRS